MCVAFCVWTASLFVFYFKPVLVVIKRGLLIGKMLFFRRQAHLCTFSVQFHKENDFSKLFRLIVCFVLIKNDKNCQKKRMRDVRAKKCDTSKIVLISGLGNEDFQSFTEIINLAKKGCFAENLVTSAVPLDSKIILNGSEVHLN